LSPACSSAAGITAYCERFQFIGSGSVIGPISRSSCPLTNSRPVRLNATMYIARLRSGTASSRKCSRYQASDTSASSGPFHSLASATVSQWQCASGSVSPMPSRWQNSACEMVREAGRDAWPAAAGADAGAARATGPASSQPASSSATTRPHARAFVRSA